MGGILSDNIAKAIMQDFIENGTSAQGDRMPTVKALADRYQASSSTVRKALDILEGYGAIVKRQGSGIYIADRAQATEPTGNALIGYIGPASGDHINMEVYRGIELVAKNKGYQVTVTSSRYDYDEERTQVLRLAQSGCQAVIVTPSFTRNDEQFENDYLKTELQDFPIILVDIAYPNQHRPMVLFDNYRAGYDMTRLTISEGHKRIAFMRSDMLAEGSHHHLRSNMERFRGYCDAMASVGLTVAEDDIWNIPYPLSPEETNITRYLMQWQNAASRPTAVICTEDNAVIRTISIAREMDISVPKDLCMVGFDNLPHGRIFRPNFHTTSPDFSRAGQIAAETAFEAMEKGVEAISGRIYILPVPVIRRVDYNLCEEKAPAQSGV